jgi:hypothetical protein
MSDGLEIVLLDPSDRLCCPESLIGTDEIFSKLSDYVRFCKLEGQRDCAIYFILQEKGVEGRARESSRAPGELTPPGQGIGHCLSDEAAMSSGGPRKSG